MDKKKIINIAIIAGIFIFQFVIAYFVFTKIIFKDDIARKEKLTQTEEKSEESTEEISKETEKPADNEEAVKNYAKNFAVLTLDNFQEIVVNPQNSEGHILMISIGLEYRLKEKKLPEEIDVKLAILKNNLNLLLASQLLSDLYNFEYRETLAGQMLATLNKSLVEGELTRVFITEYIIQ
ncbi:MAG: flagellar basal body-associated FliL family protein [Candidatus Cloacimonetes bacterium]|nr:flagellar basal body-associated FliL family protein [Candidatus Cloacimonadota bacterium]